MTEAEARADIELLTEAATDPVLSTGQVDYLVRMAKRADAGGRAPSDDDWEETWDIAYAVCRGWELKAGNAVSRFDFSSVNEKFDRSQVQKHCREQAKEWRRKVGCTVEVPGRTNTLDAELDDGAEA
jgi:hypothetical protein